MKHLRRDESVTRRAVAACAIAWLSAAGAGCSGAVSGPVPGTDPAPDPGRLDAGMRPRDAGGAASPDAAPDATAAGDTSAPVADGGAPPPDGQGGPADGAGGADASAPAGAWARGVRVGLVEAAQGVFVRLGQGDQLVAGAQRNAELIEGRALFVRVHVETEGAAFQPRRLRGVLTLVDAGGAELAPLTDEKAIDRASDPDDVATTFNFLVPAASVKPGLRLFAGIHETSASEAEPPARLPRFPATGSFDLAVVGGKMELDLVLVPAIGMGGPLMDTPERRQRVEKYLYDVYPIQKLNARWREPLRFPRKIAYTAGFQALQQARTQDGAKPSEYYHLLIAVEDTSEGYLGIASIASARAEDAARRIAITFVRKRSIDSELDTISHEMGHNHGQNHVPGCKAQGVDTKYPYPNTAVGVSGYSLTEGAFKPAKMYKDLMGYCYPTWIGDYTWNAFARRVRAISALPGAGGGGSDAGSGAAPFLGRSLQGFAGPDGSVAWTVVDGALAGPAARADATTFAEVTVDGVRQRLPVAVQRLSDDAGRELTVDLPAEGAIEGAAVTVAGQRHVVPQADLAR